jgi:hypothetical protein
MVQAKRVCNKSFGPILCPLCGRNGIFIGRIYKMPRNTWGPYFYVQHTRKGSMVRKGETETERIIHCAKKPLDQCYLGKLTEDKLDEIVKNRPWPLNAAEVIKVLTGGR